MGFFGAPLGISVCLTSLSICQFFAYFGHTSIKLGLEGIASDASENKGREHLALVA